MDLFVRCDTLQVFSSRTRSLNTRQLGKIIRIYIYIYIYIYISTSNNQVNLNVDRIKLLQEQERSSFKILVLVNVCSYNIDRLERLVNDMYLAQKAESSQNI
jgi:hypothetical protein